MCIRDRLYILWGSTPDRLMTSEKRCLASPTFHVSMLDTIYGHDVPVNASSAPPGSRSERDHAQRQVREQIDAASAAPGSFSRGGGGVDEHVRVPSSAAITAPGSPRPVPTAFGNASGHGFPHPS